MIAPRITPVILSGGSGTRLWPVSTKESPKQFLPLTGERSMFRLTLDRCADRAIFAPPMIVCGAGHIDFVERDLMAAGIADATIMVEPAARNTAPAIALAALATQAAWGDAAPILVMPSDHVMTDAAAFSAAVDAALPVVAGGALATFGITPSHPETGYGYIAMGDALAGHAGVRRVNRFVEKPDRARAESMLLSGGHVWNAGIFLMQAGAFLAALGQFAPDMASRCAQAMAGATRNGPCVHPDAAAFAQCPSNSIDYAVMERAENVVVAPVNPGWSDVGSWSAIHAL
ncbi:MAG: mannose-1-phosphate guanylyltransferase, partial [Sphingopyxis sp.]